jgi:hypothetical protein
MGKVKVSVKKTENFFLLRIYRKAVNHVGGRTQESDFRLQTFGFGKGPRENPPKREVTWVDGRENLISG